MYVGGLFCKFVSILFWQEISKKKILPFEISFITLSVLTIFEHLFKHNLERKSLSVLGAVVAV